MKTGNVTTCPKCHVVVGLREDGTMFGHDRYIDGGGYGPSQDHTMVRCEGSGKKPGEVS